MKDINIYAMGLKVIEEKEKLYKAVSLAPTDIRYSEFVKYRRQWIKEIVALEDEYKNTCILYNNEPLPEVMARNTKYFTI